MMVDLLLTLSSLVQSLANFEFLLADIIGVKKGERKRSRGRIGGFLEEKIFERYG